MTKSSNSSVKVCPFKSAYSQRSREPKLHEVFFQKLQIHTISNPRGLLARIIQMPISVIEGQAANLPHYLSYKRAAFGENFCCAGQVVLGEWDEVQKALTSPQSRTFRLGTAVMSESRLPKANGQTSFLLSLGQKDAGGDGSWEAYNGAFYKYIIGGAHARQGDPVAQGLMDKLVEDYRNMNHESGGEFFSSTKAGMLPFLNKYLHYCLWNIDPNDNNNKDTIDTLLSFYYGGTPPALYWLNTFGFAYNKINKDIASDIEEVATIYENSSVLKNFQRNEVNGISRRKMAELIIPIMGIAATQGPKHLIFIAMGENPIREYKEGVDTTQIKPTDFWDKLDLNDSDEVGDYLLECGRLDQPVGHTHRVAMEEFSVEMMGKKRTFPKDTIISIPINMCCVNRDVYGDSVFEFDHKRDNLRETSTIFHSVGDKHAGRICPGRGFAMRMMTEILQRTGKVRREKK